MKLSSIRDLASLKAVLFDPNTTGPDPAYWLFTEVSHDKWFNNTILPPGKHGQEYNKTFGHYHPDGAPNETYQVIYGEGLFIMQKKDLSEVCLVKVKTGDEVVITPVWGHALINTGSLPVITFDDWRIGHTPADYSAIEQLHGMAYYLIDEAGQPKVAANPHYEKLPEPQWISAEEFSRHIYFNSSLSSSSS